MPSEDVTCSRCRWRFTHFRPWPVTILSTIIYLPILIAILHIHYVPPKAPPANDIQYNFNLNISHTWENLAKITSQYHPYNSHANDRVRDFILKEVKSITKKNGLTGYTRTEIIDDRDTNVLFTYDTSSTQRKNPKVSIYFESLNVIVVVHGTEDLRGKILVNCHFDSVSTAPGATDDGVAVVSVLALIDYFTQKAHIPKRSLIFLLNNGEEDYLNGAVAFSRHQQAKVARMFLNLEGAGAGGRATLFRSTDAEITRFYQKARHPFGSSLSGDGFKLGLVKSQTDYVVFDGEVGLRGLDVAFWTPRSRYHTQYDDVGHTSLDSVWHMLGNSIDTLKAMTEDLSDDFMKGKTGSTGVWWDMFGRSFAVMRLQDLFSVSMAFLTITPVLIFVTIFLLVRTDRFYLFTSSPKSNIPLPYKLQISGWKGIIRYPVMFVLSTGAVFGVALLIAKVNPMIMYSSMESVYLCLISTWFVVSFWIMKAAAVWRPSASQRVFTLGWAWIGWWAAMVLVTIMEDRHQLGGGYFIHMYYAAAFVALFISLLEFFALPKKSTLYEPGHGHGHQRTASEAADHDAIGPDQNETTGDAADEDEEPTESTPLFGRNSRSRSMVRSFWIPRPSRSADSSRSGEGDDDDDRCDRGRWCASRQYPREQYWSRFLPRQTWALQALVVLPVPLIFGAHLAILIGTAVAQTGADGSSVVSAFLIFGFFSILLMLPLSPFMHRFTHHVPIFFLALFLATFIYNLTAFPFSSSNQLKVYFQQSVNSSTGENEAHLVGVDKYVKRIVKNIPSSWGHKVRCDTDGTRKGLTSCSWESIMPNVMKGSEFEGMPLDQWTIVNATDPLKGKKPGKGKDKDGKDGKDDDKDEKETTRTINLKINGANTRACKVNFNRRVTGFKVLPLGSNPHIHSNLQSPESFHVPALTRELPMLQDDESDDNYVSTSGGEMPEVAESGAKQLRLWSRDWNRGWDVNVTYPLKSKSSDSTGPWISVPEEDKLTGTVICLWSDANHDGVIPALDEVKAFLPDWAVVSKLSDGLVEVGKDFEV